MKSSWNSIGFNHNTLFNLFFFYFIFRDVFAISSKPMCHPKQRDALLEFKNDLEIQKPCFDGFLKTKSWMNNTNCCSWDGITCDTNFGDVIEVNISFSCLHGWFSSKSNIFRLHKLRLLDLSNNDLSGEILSSLTNLSHLTYLDLTHNKFSGKIPSSLENLLHLTHLEISDNKFVGKIPSTLGNLFHLISLGLCANNFVGKIPSSLGYLSHLTELALCENNFVGEIPSSFANLSHLTFLDLSQNHFTGEFPSYFGSFNKLVSISIDNNKFSGNFPFIPLLNLTGLLDLSVYNNQLTGTLPPNMSLLSNLGLFYVSNNAFTGTLPPSLFAIPKISDIDMSYNKLNGTLEFGNMSSSLVNLYLGKNSFIGPIPRTIVKLVNLHSLDLSHLNTQGLVDFSIFSHLQSLEELDLSHLNTTTAFDLNEIFSYFKSLDTLDLSGNHISVDIKVLISDYPLLTQLNLSRCGLTKFPEFLRTQYEMRFFDISNNEIKGQVPSWLWSLPNLTYVDLSNNKFIGFNRSMNPGLFSTEEPQMKYLSGANNDFSGNIPYFICGLHSLTILDLSNNKFSGPVPRCLGNFSMTLEALILRKNRLSGGFPDNLSTSLVSLDLGHNQLVGKLPVSLVHISSLEVFNVESNKINDTFPFWLSSLRKLKVLVLRSNAFHGPIQQVEFSQLRIIDLSSNHFNGILPSNCFINWTAMFSLGISEDKSNRDYIGTSYYSDSMVLMNKGREMKLERILNIFTAVDFSKNKFEGEIPSSIGLLKELHVLSLSNNAFFGPIPSTMAYLIELESLDVSHNKLSGEIPQELGKLSFLSYMDFSHNQFVGPIPGSTQFQTQPCSSFEENPGLFGPILDRVCADIHKKTSQLSETQEQREDEEEVISWIAAAIGFIPGISFGFMMGYILLSLESNYFMKTFGRNKQETKASQLIKGSS